MKKNLRLFIAVPITSKLRRKFFNLVNQLKNTGTNVKWVEEGNFHLTLKFLGDTPSTKVNDIVEEVQKSLEGHESIRLKFKGVGVFPNVRKPRVVWIGLSRGHKELADIAGVLEDVLEPLGFEKEKRKFKSHLTIGRVRSNKGIGDLTREIIRLKEYDGGNMKLTEIHLVKSELTRNGPVYTVLNRFPLVEKEEENGN